MKPGNRPMNPNEQPLRRRDFLSGTSHGASIALTAAALVKAANAPAAPKTGPAIKVGIVGCGGRGSWIAGLFKQHGGYQFVAAADYFQDRADKTGTSLGVDEGEVLLRPVGLQAADRKRRGGRDPGDAALLLPRARRGRRRGRPARLHGQAGGRRRARHAEDRRARARRPRRRSASSWSITRCPPIR